MAHSAKPSEEEKQLAAARSELAAAQKKHATTLSREGAAAKSADRYAMWTSECAGAEAEVRRLTKLVAALEVSIQEAAQAAADAAKRLEACRAANQAAAQRLRTDGARLMSEILTLTREVATAAMEAERLNGDLPNGVPSIPIADYAARDTLVRPREHIETKEQILWVHSLTGELIGDQNSVTDNKDGTGTVQVNRSTAITCIWRRYAATTYYPSHAADHPGHFFSNLRLPFVDRPGLLFDGSRVLIDDVAQMSVEPPQLPKFSRQVRLELKPLDPWVPMGGLGEAGRAVVS